MNQILSCLFYIYIDASYHYDKILFIYWLCSMSAWTWFYNSWNITALFFLKNNSFLHWNYCFHSLEWWELVCNFGRFSFFFRLISYQKYKLILLSCVLFYCGWTVPWFRLHVWCSLPFNPWRRWWPRVETHSSKSKSPENVKEIILKVWFFIDSLSP